MNLSLNTLSPTPGSRSNRTRVGRGIGSGLGKTCGKGHKGQKSRAGGYHRINFEGGQMPLQRRLPKFGFTSRKKSFSQEITLTELSKLSLDDESKVTLQVLKDHSIIKKSTLYVKVILSGELTQKVNLIGMKATKGAQAAIESQGGKIQS